jgi:hypothetical protein
VVVWRAFLLRFARLILVGCAIVAVSGYVLAVVGAPFEFVAGVTLVVGLGTLAMTMVPALGAPELPRLFPPRDSGKPAAR